MIRALVAAALAVGLAAPARAQEPPPDWRVEKCARYGTAWSEGLKRFRRAGQTEAFNPREVCPRSKEELSLANVMVLRAMNAGTASTFLPFACPR